MGLASRRPQSRADRGSRVARWGRLSRAPAKAGREVAAEPFLKGPERSCSDGPLTAGRKMVSGAEGGTAGLGGLAGPSRLPAAAGTTPAAGRRLERGLHGQGSGPCGPRGGTGWTRGTALVASAWVPIAFCPRPGFYLRSPVSRCIDPYSCILQVEAIGTHVTGGSMVSPVSNCQRFSFAASGSVASVLLDDGPQA